MIEALVKVERVGKTFARQTGRRKWRDLATGMWKRPARERLWALRDVSFEVMPREMLGIVGANGAGKSTMLRLLGGIGIPTSGRLEVHGRIGALLELGGGFQEDLTGRENAIMAAVVAGLLRSEAVARLDEIIAFSELENFIDAPVRTYSTGMKMRLAFSVAVHTDADVMLVDEFLSVGDLAFQAKCSTRIAALREGGCAIVLVSHSMDQVKELCDRALWLRKGEIVAFDTAKTVAQAYEQEMREETLRRTAPVPARIMEDGTELRAGTNRIGSFEAEVVNVVLRPGARISTGNPLEVEICYHSPSRVENPLFSVSITRADETLCLDINTESARVAVPEIHGSGSIRLIIDRLDLSSGAYFVNVGIFESSWQYAYDYHSDVYNLLVEGGGAHKGVLAPPCRWST